MGQLKTNDCKNRNNSYISVETKLYQVVKYTILKN